MHTLTLSSVFKLFYSQSFSCFITELRTEIRDIYATLNFMTIQSKHQLRSHNFVTYHIPHCNTKTHVISL